MLRLIMASRFTAPSNDKDTGDSVDLVVEQGEQGIDDIAKPAVLQVDKRDFSCCQMIARSKRRCIPFVDCNHMRGTRGTVGVHQIVNQRAQL